MHFTTALVSLATVAAGLPNAPQPPSLTYLFAVNITVAAPIVIGTTPLGFRQVYPITGGTVKGPKLNGTVANWGGDWGLTDSAGTFRPDARYIIQSDDGANIYVTAQGYAPPGSDFDAQIFETGSEKYSWLNNALCVSSGEIGDNGVVLQVWQAT
ncbi:Hydroalkoxylation enzyme phnH [Cladobotryum mycophilum]|uniref:Hydroalkoxylation enzyme phnH n=1 Tax=Cladobotryum mycophilum TaxID=491253 RepID=A0ABR0SBQ4_9HYPO